MQDYKEIRKICEKNSRISERVVDDFLVPYAARHRGLEKKMNQHFDRYQKVTSKFDKSTMDRLKGQYIIHKVFRKDWLIHKLLRNPALERFTGEEADFLKQNAAVPWRFSFAEVLEQPEPEFFRMEDVFSGQEYRGQQAIRTRSPYNRGV